MNSPFSASPHYRPRSTCECRGVVLPEYFDDPAAEYDGVKNGAGLFDRSDRGLIIVTGKDRAAWLHNLVTNSVKTLSTGLGCYAFAIDVRGRVIFDLNILALPDALWLDIDIEALPAALTHLKRYKLAEDVTLTDATASWARLGVSGPAAMNAASQFAGLHDLESAPALSHSLVGGIARIVRDDFAGLPGVELFVPRADAAEWWTRFANCSGVRPAGLRTLDVLRIEAGIPWLGRDIDEKTIPPETSQIERGISYTKGCYLGQEVIERMRSHGFQARSLLRLRTENGAGLELPAPLRRGEENAGRVTSLVAHPCRRDWVGLGYLRTAIKEHDGITAGDPPRPITIVE